MIKLELAPKPEKLTIDFQKERTEKFKTTGKSVWDDHWLREAISKMSYGKCCYSEIRLDEESKYMEVEHFIPKDVDPDLVMEWGNLLPSCKKCNVTKGKHNTVALPIVNPFVDNPKEFFFIKDSIFFPKESKMDIAKRTIRVVGLNDNHFAKPRLRIDKRIHETVSDLFESINEVLDKSKQERYLGKLTRLMKEGIKEEPYAALISTLILTDKNYIAIEAFLKKKDLWNDELKELKTELEFCSLPE